MWVFLISFFFIDTVVKLWLAIFSLVVWIIKYYEHDQKTGIIDIDTYFEFVVIPIIIFSFSERKKFIRFVTTNGPHYRIWWNTGTNSMLFLVSQSKTSVRLKNKLPVLPFVRLRWCHRQNLRTVGTVQIEDLKKKKRSTISSSVSRFSLFFKYTFYLVRKYESKKVWISHILGPVGPYRKKKFITKNVV